MGSAPYQEYYNKRKGEYPTPYTEVQTVVDN